jgi:hypothetical protein
VLQSFQFVVTFSSNQIVYRSRTTTTTTTTELSTTMQQKTYLTYHETPAPAPAFAKRRSCRVPSETPWNALQVVNWVSRRRRKPEMMAMTTLMSRKSLENLISLSQKSRHRFL